MKYLSCFIVFIVCLLIGCDDPMESKLLDSLDNGVITTDTSDEESPTWPTNATLQTDKISSHQVQLIWPSAVDNQYVATYHIYQLGIELTRVSASQTHYLITGLQESTAYQFEVSAVDASGNISERLAVNLETLDGTAPVWPADAQIYVTDITETSANLTWEAANDQSELIYQIQINEQAPVNTTELSYQIMELNPVTEYRVQLAAVDEYGLSTNRSLRLTFSTVDLTAPYFANDATITVLDLTENSMRLSWQSAIDNVGVAGYELLQNDQVIARLDAHVNTYHITGLVAGTSVNFSLIAYDEANHRSGNGPSIVVDTGDQSAPTWSENASVRVSNITPNGLLLAWSAADDNVGVAHYEITQDGVPIGSTADTQMNVQGLSSWSQYTFSVHAVDAVGNQTAHALQTHVQTPDIIAPNWMMDEVLMVEDLNTSSLMLTWPHASDDVAVVGYEVFQDGESVTQLNASVNQLQISDLMAWTNYSFRVSAFDEAGNRTQNDLTITIQTLDEAQPYWRDGNILVDDLTDQTLTLRWTAAQDNVAITRYIVQQNDIQIAQLDAETLSLHVASLSPWTHYTFTVIAEDEAGNQSPTALTISVQTLDLTRPVFAAGTGLNITEVGSTHATVSWPSATDDVAVTSYHVTLDGIALPLLNATSTQIELDQLQPMRAYLVTVRASDAANNISAELTTTINTVDGGAPTWSNPTLRAVAGITEVLLSWDPAQDDVAVTGYRVYQNGNLVASTDDTRYLVDQLHSETTYTFHVEAGDAAGYWSQNGPSAEVQTAQAYDPGFKRLTKNQYTRTISDLFGNLWTDLYARRAQLGLNNDANFVEANSADNIYTRLTTQNWGYPSIYNTTYPNDAVISGPDSPRGGFKRLDAIVYDEHVAMWVGAVLSLSAEWSAWIGEYQLIYDPCVYEYNHGLRQATTIQAAYRQCVIEVIDMFAPRALRRPMTVTERESFIAIYDEVPQVYANQGLNESDMRSRAIGNVLSVIALQPEVSYHVEVGDEHGHLTAYELASRLSYHFWNSMPDQVLFAAAADGSLFTEAGYQAQVDRLFNDPKTNRSLREFYTGYFRTDTLHNVNSQDSPGGGWGQYYYHVGPNHEAGEIPIWNNSNGSNEFIQDALASELINLGRYYTYIAPNSFESMFRSNLHLMECQNPPWGNQEECSGAGPWSQAIYGINGHCQDFADCAANNWLNANIGWDGVSQPVEFTETERVGLITRMSFLAHDTYQARPIRRGLQIREMLLCDPIPPPENCDVVQPPSLTGKCTNELGTETTDCTSDIQCATGESCVGWDRSVRMTVREKVTELTEQPNSSCAQCHTTLINGFGHALGHFSSLGKYWETEHMFTNQQNEDGDFWYFTSTPDQWRAIDTSGSTIMNGQFVSFDGAAEVADILVESGQMEWCWSREYFRFTFARHEWESDADTIEAIAQSLRDGDSLASAYKAMVHTAQFQTLYKAPRAPSEGAE